MFYFCVIFLIQNIVNAIWVHIHAFMTTTIWPDLVCQSYEKVFLDENK